MEQTLPFDLTDVDAMMSLVSSVFAELNIGLLIYHLEEEGDPHSLKLVYANRSASEYTETDLSPRIGRFVLDAFPALEGTILPQTFAEVALTGKSENIGAFEYGGDDELERSYYAVKAFSMPNHCVGVAFENITLRKQLEEMVRKLREKEKR